MPPLRRETRLLRADLIEDVVFREALDSDADAVIALLSAIYAEYPGCILDVAGEAPELLALASSHRAMGGKFWLAERAGKVLGCVGWRPLEDGAVELLKLYVDAEARGGGLGRRLVGIVCAEARKRGAARVELWTDTRFQTAHRLYELLGFRREPGMRQLNDLSRSVEYHYGKSLEPSDSAAPDL